MGIAAASRAQYENAIKKLFPQGDYWDKEFADPEGDVSLFAKAKADELFRFRSRMRDLQNESRIETANELIDDWERVLLGKTTYGKTLTERRLFLLGEGDDNINRAKLQKMAETHGFSIDITFPYRPAFFGHARFNTSFLVGPVGFSVLLLTASRPQAEFYALFADGFRQFGAMRFGQDRLSWLPRSPYFEKAFANYIVREKQLFKDFEQALQNRLLANQKPFFSYEGA
jgi:uncharacterized protein YmfQ (DUF2313 family)